MGGIPIWVVGCTAPIGLYHLVQLILANLNECTTGIGQPCGIRVSQHILAVRRACDLEAPAETGVGVHFVVYNVGWLLCQQQDIYAKRSANRKDAVDYRHKIGELYLEFGKFVDHHKQEGEWLRRHALFVSLYVGGNIADAALVKERLASRKLIFKCSQIAADAGVQIGNRSREMRQITE